MSSKNRTSRTEETIRFFRFCVVGVLNSLISFFVFWILRRLGTNLYTSNLASYIAGVVNSFIWNKKWVYRSTNRKWIKEVVVFVLFFLLCYGLQMIAFRLAIGLGIHEMISQIIGMVIFSASNYILNRLFNFKNERTE